VAKGFSGSSDLDFLPIRLETWSQVENCCRVFAARGRAVKPTRLRTLKTISLALILPGLAGLIVSAMLSVHYLDTMPRWPSPEELRTVPRSIHGIVVYQTAAEDRKLDLMEYSSVGVFAAGLILGLVYLQKWGARQARASEEEDRLTRNYP
jgi:hypothetical protein